MTVNLGMFGVLFLALICCRCVFWLSYNYSGVSVTLDDFLFRGIVFPCDRGWIVNQLLCEHTTNIKQMSRIRRRTNDTENSAVFVHLL